MTSGPPPAPYWRIAACDRARRDARRLRARQPICQGSGSSGGVNLCYLSWLAWLRAVPCGANKPGGIQSKRCVGDASNETGGLDVRALYAAVGEALSERQRMEERLSVLFSILIGSVERALA
jgi:hypothetical protein